MLQAMEQFNADLADMDIICKSIIHALLHVILCILKTIGKTPVIPVA